MSTPSTATKRGTRLLEVAAVCILSVATVGSAWCAYQASQWNGEASRLSRAASDQHIEASRLFALATQTLSYDTNTIALYAAAVASENDSLAQFYRDAMVRDGAQSIIDEWTAAVQAGQTPTQLLDNDEYMTTLLKPYDDATAQAEANTAEASDASDTADTYVLATVLLAVSLFFAGVTSSFRMRVVKIVLLGASGFALAFAAASIAGLGVQ